MTPNKQAELICEVCRKNPAVGVASGACGAVSSAYCKVCLERGAEPWGYLVGYLFTVGREDVHPSYHEIIKASCEVVGKTVDEFWEECERVIGEYEDYYTQHDKGLAEKL